MLACLLFSSIIYKISPSLRRVFVLSSIPIYHCTSIFTINRSSLRDALSTASTAQITSKLSVIMCKWALTRFLGCGHLDAAPVFCEQCPKAEWNETLGRKVKTPCETWRKARDRTQNPRIEDTQLCEDCEEELMSRLRSISTKSGSP